MAAEDSGDVLHWTLRGEHVLFTFVRLDSFGGFLGGALLSIGICACERFLAYAHERKWCPQLLRRSKVGYALWRAGLYWLLAFLRLAYMLIAMSLNLGLIIIIVSTLAIGQFLIELRGPHPNLPLDREYAPLEDAPLHSRPSSDAAYARHDSQRKSNMFAHSNGAPRPSTDAFVLSNRESLDLEA